ncbi:hypothetical protein RN51_01632 [Microbacterium oxydans]|uniref:Uncharacterized protein n=1 Tax=Microbacterium oxydans TaxID=82380 RepID=A0A0F0KPQ3_9MICO|nr:hypothetical protein [Microbacterium oxydans]KJL22887.1 hypothetical protein RN51_01632 [Microbacterium oxydans]
MTDTRPATGDIDLRLVRIFMNVRARRSKMFRVIEAILYGFGGLAFITGVVVAMFGGDSLWNGVGLAGLGVTIVGAGIALSIFRVQADQSVQDSQRADLMLNQISAHAKDAADHSKKAHNIVEQLQRSRRLADQETEQATKDMILQKLEELRPEVQPETDVNDTSDESSPSESATDAGDIVKVEGDGEYRYPSAVPLYVIADLVNWFPKPAPTRWTVANLLGAYRKYNSKGKLTGVPWILTFRRTNGDQVDYRISYAGRGDGPSISVYSSERNRWQDFQPPTQAEQQG